MARLRYNGLTATLGADLLTADTTITFTAALTSAAGAVPTITGSDYIPLVVLDTDGGVLEIIHLTAYTSGATTGTVTRAEESTTAGDRASGLTVVNGLTVADTVDFATSGPAYAPITYSGTLGSAFSSSAVATWTPVTGLTFSLTPAANGFLNLNSRVRINHPSTSNLYSRATITPAPVSGSQYLSYTQEAAPVGRQTLPFFGTWQLASGTAYTVTVDIYVATSASAWTVDATPEDTTLSGTFFPAA